MKLYVVMMNRWGETENPTHSYIEGIYDDPVRAQEQGEEEMSLRGGKYEPQILTMDLNQTKALRQKQAKEKNKGRNFKQELEDRKRTLGSKIHFPKKRQKKIIV